MLMKKSQLILSLALSVCIFATTVFALSLDEAKSRGLVGETQSGYLGAVTTPDSETKNLINDINAKRKAKYAEIAAKNGTAVAAVEALAGKKAVQETAPGNYVQLPSGAWTKK